LSPAGGARSSSSWRGSRRPWSSSAFIFLVILAGTFATLTLIPLAPLAQIGATVAFGILLDTFVVRALLVPALTVIAGERAWWPRLASRSGVR
jgi:uncharacterized membrane protein YdfJ with MMPL/SSD domain